jgi:hypothetical protein
MPFQKGRARPGGRAKGYRVRLAAETRGSKNLQAAYVKVTRK